jgi:hypothetical protein
LGAIYVPLFFPQVAIFGSPFLRGSLWLPGALDEADRHLAIFSPFTQRLQRAKKQDVISLEMEWVAC